MKPLTMILTGFLLMAGLAAADVWEDLARYDAGTPPDTATQAFELLRVASADQYVSIEEKLIGVITDRNATSEGKAFACRLLRHVGTERCIPALRGLLHDATLSDYARLVLETLNESPKAGEALLTAMEKAPDDVKVGIIASLGERRDAEAVKPLGKLACSKHEAIARAAIMALGKTGNAASNKSLRSLRVDDALQDAVVDALVMSAGRLGGKDALSSYKKVLKSRQTVHRVAAIAGIVQLNTREGAQLILAALRGDDDQLAQGVLSVVADTSGQVSGLTEALLPWLDMLDGQRKAGLVRALGLRGDVLARDAMLACIKSKDPEVHQAAVVAAARLGDGDTAAVLLRLQATGEAEARMETVLARMAGDGVEAALTDALDSPSLRKRAIKVLGLRGNTAAASKMLQRFGTFDAETKVAGWEALALLADVSDADALMKAALAAADDKELRAANMAIKKMLLRADDTAECFRIIAGHYDLAPASVKNAVMALAAMSADHAALALVRKSLTSKDSDCYRAGVRALAAWPDTSADTDLIALAWRGRDEVDRILALRGYITIAGLKNVDLAPAERVERLKTAMGMAKRLEEKKLIISTVGKISSVAALDMLNAHASNAELANEVNVASVAVAWLIRDSDPDRAAAVARRFAQGRDGRLTGQARKTLCAVEDARRTWQVSDVYRGQQARVFYDSVLAPEAGATVDWHTDLPDTRGDDPMCWFARTTVVAPSNQTISVLVDFGRLASATTAKIFVNGRIVSGVYRGPERYPMPHRAHIDCEKGRNVLMFKLVGHRGPLTFSCSFSGPGGMPLRGQAPKPLGPRDVNPYLGLYEGTYEVDGKTVQAEARVASTGSNSAYTAVIAIDPEAVGTNRFAVHSNLGYDPLDLYTSKDGREKGVQYAYYEGQFRKLELDGQTPAATGTLPTFSLDPKTRDDNYAFRFTGFVKIPSAGRYAFTLSCDDSGRLQIGDKVVVESQNGWYLHLAQKGVVELAAGMHPLTVDYAQGGRLSKLAVGIRKLEGDDEKHVMLSGEGLGSAWQGQLLPETLVLKADDPGQGRFVLTYADRQSPTLGRKPPAGAVVLIGAEEGQPPSLEEWTNKAWMPLDDGSMQVGKGANVTIKEFGDVEMHAEFLCPYEPEQRYQSRGNSGVYLQGNYELQVLDSFGFPERINTCGAVYYTAANLRAATLPPLTWQTYDVIFRAARYSTDGDVEQDTVFEEVKLNGRVIHKDLVMPKRTYAGLGGPMKSTGPLMLQDHKNLVRYRNVWIKPLK